MFGAVLKHSGFLLLLVLTTMAPCGHAQAPVSIEHKYVRTDFTTDQGLPSNKVNAILQTDNGLLWIATGSGLASFDGHNFSQIQLHIPGAAPAESVNALALGTDGDLWVGTDAGIVRIPKGDLNSPYLSVTKGYRLGSAHSDEVGALFCAHDGAVWAGTNHGLYRFDGEEFHLTLDVPVFRIHQALNGTLLLITSQGFLDFDGRRAISHPELPQRFGVSKNSIFEALQSPDGTMWFGTFKGIHAIGERAESLAPSPVDTTPVYRGYVAPDGAMWFSTTIGLFRVNGDHLETPAPGLKVRIAFMGSRGDIWIGSTGSGIIHLQPRVVRNYTAANGFLATFTNTVLSAQDGSVWVGNNCGVAVLNGNELRTYAEKDGLLNTCVDALAEDRMHDIWLGSYGGGLFRFHRGVFTQYSLPQGLISAYVTKVTVAQDNSLWLGTLDGLSHYENGHITNYTTADGLANNRILDVHEDRNGALWVATQGGINKLSSGHFVAIPSVPSREEVLSRRFVEDSQGNLYTTNVPRGLSRIQENHSTLINDSLALFNAVEAQDRRLWFTSLHGIVGLSESELAKLGSSDDPISFRQIDRVEGMISSQATGGSPDIALTKDGTVWVATGEGLAAIDINSISRTGELPSVFVADVAVDGKRRHVGRMLELSPGLHHLEFRLAAVDLQTPEKVRVQYRLEGVDPTWLDADASRTVVYTGLATGSHQLMVRAADSVGNWSSGATIYGVLQRPFFYQTVWFFTLCVAAAGFLIWIIYQSRVRYVCQQVSARIEAQTSERLNVSRDLHDTLLQSVQGLLLSFHALSEDPATEGTLRSKIVALGDRAERVIEEGREKIKALRFETRPHGSFTEEVTRLARELNPEESPVFQISINGNERELNPMVYQEMCFICREALHNSFRHATAETIEVLVNFARTRFAVTVRDDGQGFQPDAMRHGSQDGHWGVVGMRERAARIGAEIHIHHSYPERIRPGTAVLIDVPAGVAYATRMV